MTQILSSRIDKDITLLEIEAIIDRHVIVGCTPKQQAQILDHMKKLRYEKGDLRVNCRFETVPELRSTRIHLELSFVPVPSFSDPIQKKI